MGAEPFRLARSGVGGAHALPQRDRLVRVVAGQRHQHEADTVGFRFLRARHRQQDADRGAGAQRRHHRRQVGAAAAAAVAEQRQTAAAVSADAEPPSGRSCRSALWRASACATSWPITAASPASVRVIGRMPV